MRGVRFLLFPFSVLYNVITGLRNLAFNIGVLPQKSYEIPVIAVGNLSTGGTGKTPMIEYLVAQNQEKRIAILSRGYGRATSGFIELTNMHTAGEVGDEPLQFKKKFGAEVIVAVCEQRVAGIDNLLASHKLDLILLDDAYQHRYVKASEYVLLSSYDKPYFRDFLLPMGNLREARRGAKRAKHIVITKCPPHLSIDERHKLCKKINPLPFQKVYFSTIAYTLTALNNYTSLSLESLKGRTVTVVTGIAKPQPFIDFLSNYMIVHHLKFKDHHHFTQTELDDLSSKELIITTEKDFMRLNHTRWNHVYYVPIATQFLGAKL